MTELTFRDSWLSRLHSAEELTLNGWYEPPPLGMAVLFADERDVHRISYESLRLPEFAPSPRVMKWAHGMMYAYCSPVHRPTGMAGDFGVTLYFGSNLAIRDHFRRAYAATAALLGEINSTTRSTALLHRSELLFKEYGLKNTIASITDSVPLDLGHSIPIIAADTLRTSRQLSKRDQQLLGEKRRFVSTSVDWALAEEDQVTIEPQLVNPARRTLPQVSFHYIVAARSSPVTLLQECDGLLREFGLRD